MNKTDGGSTRPMARHGSQWKEQEQLESQVIFFFRNVSVLFRGAP